VPLEAFGQWRESPHKFQRRAVPVSMLPLLKKEKDFGPLLDFLRPLMMDGEKVVRQGLGWFLREAWKKQPVPVEAFLLEWKDTAPRLIFQYATEKMTPENKARFRRAK
jgi:3-methyladenine DNA glycosylase AlkD